MIHHVMTRSLGLISLFVLSVAGPDLVQAQETLLVQIQPHAEMALPPLALDMLADSDGRVVGTLGALDGLSGLTLKRGVVSETPNRETLVTHDAVLSRTTSAVREPLGDVRVQWRQPSGHPGTRPEGHFGEVRTLPASTASLYERENRRTANAGRSGGDGGVDIILWDVVGVASAQPGVVSLTYTSSNPAHRLRGEPAHLFNQPTAGEDLELLIPITQGLDFEELLTIYDGPSAEVLIRVKIKHEI